MDELGTLSPSTPWFSRAASRRSVFLACRLEPGSLSKLGFVSPAGFRDQERVGGIMEELGASLAPRGFLACRLEPGSLSKLGFASPAGFCDQERVGGIMEELGTSLAPRGFLACRLEPGSLSKLGFASPAGFCDQERVGGIMEELGTSLAPRGFLACRLDPSLSKLGFVSRSCRGRLPDPALNNLVMARSATCSQAHSHAPLWREHDVLPYRGELVGVEEFELELPQ